jgi:hypothetical protein
MKIQRDQIGANTERMLWVCDTQWGHRILKPTQGVIKGNGRTEGYRFHKLNKNGKPSTQSMPLKFRDCWKYDLISIFDNEADCINFFATECNKQIAYYQNLINEVI